MSRKNNRILHDQYQFLSDMADRPYSEARSLPGTFYTSSGWLSQEQEKLFGEHWVCVGRAEEVGNVGDYLTIDLSGEPVLVIHGLDGSLRALSNVCRHRGTVIMEGAGNTNQILCPYHHWRYDTSGQLTNAPSISARVNFEPANCRLPEFQLEIWLGFIFVSLSNNADALSPQLSSLENLIKPYHLKEMHLHYCANEVWNVNWKCLLENFMEGYHLSPLHRKTLHKVNPTRLCKHLDPGTLYFGYEVGFTSRVPDDTVGHSELTADQLNNCIMFAVPPGLTVGVGSDYSSFLCIRPDSVDKVAVKLGLIFHGENWRRRDIDNAIALFQKTMEEDKTVLLRVQQGMGSRFHESGPLAPKEMEGTIWDFYQYLCKSMC